MARLTVTYTDGARLTIVQDLVPEFSPEAQAMLDVYSTLGVALVGNELNYMVAYVDALVASGNYLLFDYENIYPLGKTNEINGLIDWKGSKVATNNGATFDVFGATFAGAEGINSNWNSANDGVNYQQSNAQVAVYTKLINPSGLMSAFSSVGSTGVILRDNNDSNNSNYKINGLGNPSRNFRLLDNQLTILARLSASSEIIYINGLQSQSSGNSSSGLDINNIIIGSSSYSGTISSIMIGAAIGFDQPQYNTDLRALLTGLGTI